MKNNIEKKILDSWDNYKCYSGIVESGAFHEDHPYNEELHRVAMKHRDYVNKEYLKYVKESDFPVAKKIWLKDMREKYDERRN